MLLLLLLPQCTGPESCYPAHAALLLLRNKAAATTTDAAKIL